MTMPSFFFKKIDALALCILALVISLGLSNSSSSQSLYDPGTIQSITIEGNQRFSDANVAAIIPARVGDDFDPLLIDATIKALFNTGQFADVRVARNGNQLIINLLENLVLDIIAFEGNSSVDSETLSNVIVSKTRQPFTRNKVQTDIRRMLQVYEAQGIFSVDITPKLITLTNNRANLVFEIVEGKKARIDSILFIGNQAFRDGDLRNAIQSRQQAPWRLFSPVDTYNSARIALDIQLLERFYQERGYADFRVLSASGEQTTTRSGFLVTFHVDEGQLYRFGSTTIQSDIGGFDGEQLRSLVKTRQGNRFDLRDIEETQQDMEDTLGDLGYAFAEIRVERDNNPLTGISNLTYVLEEGRKVFVERIDISGNDGTLDRVIRREFRLEEGDAFSRSLVQRSLQRVQSLGYFQSVDVDTIPGSAADRVILDVSVVEDRTNQFTFGGTVSSQSGFLGNVGVTFGNLGGRGQSASINAVAGQSRQTLDVSFTEPWLLGREILGTASVLFDRDTDPTAAFNSQDFGGRFSLGYKLSENVSQNWSYELNRSNIYNVSDDAPFIIAQDAGIAWLSIVGQDIAFDSRDNLQNPREGWLLRLSNDLAGIGGDVSYLKNTASVKHYIPVRDESSIALLIEGGNLFGLGRETRISDRFFFGGDLVRGFSSEGLTPRCNSEASEESCPGDVALGGTLYYRASAELRFPFPILGEQGFSGRLFADAGSLWDVGSDTSGLAIYQSAEPRFSVGIGGTWSSPLGPLSVDYGLPFNVKEGDVVQNFKFAITPGF